MKKFLFILLCIMFLPMTVHAEEYCRLISGTGKDIGDEVQCGTESFYVISNDDNKIELLGKYNLYVGDNISYLDYSSDPPVFNDTMSADTYCYNAAVEAGYHPYDVYSLYTELPDYRYSVQGCRVYEKIEYDRVLQNEKAVGTRLDGTGKSILPLYGITYMEPRWGYDAVVNGHVVENQYDSNGNLILEGSTFYDYIHGYKEELERQEITVQDVSFITLSKTLDLLERISGEEVELQLEYPVLDEIGSNDPNIYTSKMDITQYLGGKYPWLYDITYWLGSGFKDTSVPFTFNDYYISNEGMLCAIGRGDCVYLPFPIGNGVRPLVTIQKSSVMYRISTKTNGNGTIEVINTAAGNDFIQFRVTSRKGYKLESIVITSDSGEIVMFNEGDLINNPDGTVSVDHNVFTMPFENVTIEARWISNPETRNFAIIPIIILALTALTLLTVKKRAQ